MATPGRGPMAPAGAGISLRARGALARRGGSAAKKRSPYCADEGIEMERYVEGYGEGEGEGEEERDVGALVPRAEMRRALYHVIV